MFTFFLIVLLLLPAVMSGFGMRWMKNPPKTINMVYGYRTAWSTKSNAAWDFAHKFTGTVWVYTGMILGLISAVILFAFKSNSIDALGNVVIMITAIQLAVLCLTIVHTEIELRKRFDKGGYRR